MAHDAHDKHAAPAAAEGKTSLLGRLRALMGGRPLWQKAVLGIGVVSVIGSGVWFSLAGSEEPVEETEYTLADAMNFMAEGDAESARIIAADLQRADKLTYDERGGPAYIHGILAAREAAEIPYADEQRRMYLVAARYLDTSYRDGFPNATSVEGLVRLGQCWHHAGRYARALPYLTQALKRRPRNPSTIHLLLAESYYRDANPQLAPALEHIEKYLADKLLTPEQRQNGLVEQARILIDSKRIADAQTVLAQIPEKSKVAAAADLLKARLEMRKAEELSPPGKPLSEEAEHLWKHAIELLRTPATDDPTGAAGQRESQYLLGLCYLRLEDYRAAENQFSRSRRLNLGLPEGTASAMEEADLHRLQGKDEAAIEIYTELLKELGDLRDYSNPWLPIDVLRERLLRAYRHYRDAEKYDVAIKFIDSLKPILTQARSMELKAEVNRRWGERLSEQAALLDDKRGAQLEHQAHARFHDAAELYYKLSKISRESKEYPDRLWASAECYQLAHDYHRTSRVMRMYLDQNHKQRHADALLAIGESELALNNLEAATAALVELLRDDSKHPLSYRARIVMQQVLVEKNKFAEARKMLLENLEHEALTPQSLEWRDSLFALAQLLYRQGLELEATSREQGVDSENEEQRKAGLKSLEQAAAAFHEAIFKYNEALQRYPDAPQSFEARYLMAECYRQASKWPRKKMPGVSIETTRGALTRQMNEELQAAHKLYSQLIEELNELQDKHPLNAKQRDLLRNCYFLQADALFDLGRYSDAIAAYSSATNRYQQRPEALEAFAQIASCYRQLNEPAKARGTLEQAKVVLRRIPEDADFVKTTRYSRDEWVQLLEFMSSL